MNISIDNKAGKTLYTQGKYCAENIVVTPVLEEISITPTTAKQTKEPSAGKAGISKVTVAAIQTEEKTATPTTSKQDITPTSGKYLSKVTVGAIQTEEKAVTVTANGTTEVTASSGKYLSKVTVTTNVPTSVIEEVSTAAEMNTLLVAENVGNAYKFTGTTDSTYTNGNIYEVVQESGSIKFNVYAPYQPISTGETWLLNDHLGTNELSFTSVNFTSNQIAFEGISRTRTGYDDVLAYRGVDKINTIECYIDSSWVDEAYRTITFETAPTGELLTWLQSNGAKQ